MRTWSLRGLCPAPTLFVLTKSVLLLRGCVLLLSLPGPPMAGGGGGGAGLSLVFKGLANLSHLSSNRHPTACTHALQLQ